MENNFKKELEDSLHVFYVLKSLSDIHIKKIEKMILSDKKNVEEEKEESLDVIKNLTNTIIIAEKPDINSDPIIMKDYLLKSNLSQNQLNSIALKTLYEKNKIKNISIIQMSKELNEKEIEKIKQNTGKLQILKRKKVDSKCVTIDLDKEKEKDFEPMNNGTLFCKGDIEKLVANINKESSIKTKSKKLPKKKKTSKKSPPKK